MAVQVTKRHPIRGFIWGIFFGLGLALIAIGQGYAALGTLPPLILLVAGIVLGTVWGLVAPAKKPKGEPPREPVQVDGPEPSRSPAEASDAPSDLGGTGAADGTPALGTTDDVGDRPESPEES